MELSRPSSGLTDPGVIWLMHRVGSKYEGPPLLLSVYFFLPFLVSTRLSLILIFPVHVTEL